MMYSKRYLSDREQWSQSSGSNVIPRRARPGLAGLRPHTNPQSGLGDIVLPGLLLCFALRLDDTKGIDKKTVTVVLGCDCMVQGAWCMVHDVGCRALALQEHLELTPFFVGHRQEKCRTLSKLANRLLLRSFPLQCQVDELVPRTRPVNLRIVGLLLCFALRLDDTKGIDKKTATLNSKPFTLHPTPYTLSIIDARQPASPGLFSITV